MRPSEAVRMISRLAKVIGALIAVFTASAKVAIRAGSCSDKRIRPNWSPESRDSVSCGFNKRKMRRASVKRIVSPADIPSPSLTCLNRSISMTNTVGRNLSCALAKAIELSKRSRNSRRLGSPVRLSCTASCKSRSSPFFCSVTSTIVPTQRMTSPSEPMTGRAFSVNQ